MLILEHLLKLKFIFLKNIHAHLKAASFDGLGQKINSTDNAHVNPGNTDGGTFHQAADLIKQSQ